MRRQTTVILASIGLLLCTQILPAQPQNATAAAVNRWTRTADLTAARSQTCAAVLKDGRLLIAGGMGVSGPVATVDIYGTDGSFIAGPPMSQARAQAACATLGDGTVLVTGGDGGSGALNTSEIFDPVAGKWSAAPSLSTAREGHSAVVTMGGSVWIAGGTNAGAVVGTIELYAAGKFQTVGALNTARTEFAMAASGERTLYIAGGTDGTNVLNTVEAYDTLFGGVTVVGTMSQGRKDFGAATLLDGTLLLTGGLDANGNLLSNSEVFDPVAGASAPGPALLARRAHHSALTLPGNGSILIYGGAGATTTLATSEIYTPWTGAIAAATPLAGARRDQANVMLRPGSLMVAGGRNDNGPLASSELYQFAYLQTDKSDYAPGTPVHITGGGWQPGENVLVTITAFPVDLHHIEFTGAATADGAGNITLNGFAVDRSHLGMKFLMTAIGSQSQAETTFTDLNSPIISVALGTYTAGTNTLDLVVTAAPSPAGNQTPTGTIVIYNGTQLGGGAGAISPYYAGAETGYSCDNATKQCTLYCAASTPCTAATITGTPQTSSVTVRVNPPAGTTTFGAAYAPDSTPSPNGSSGVYGFVQAQQDASLATFNNVASTTVSVSGPAAAFYGSPVTYMATVTPTPTGTATGRVDFCDNATGTCSGPSDSTIIGFATLTNTSGNVASFTPSTPLTVGTHKIGAYYEGDSANNPSASTTPVTTVVSATPTQVTATFTTAGPPPFTNQSAPVTITFGQSLTINITVAPQPGDGTGVPTGTVTVTDTTTSTTLINNATLTNGTYSATLPQLTGGAHNLSISYTPAAPNTYVASTSATNAVTVNAAQAPFTLSGTQTFNSVTQNLATAPNVLVTSTVTLTATYNGGMTTAPTGTITFYNSALGNASTAAICTATLGQSPNPAGVGSCNAIAGPGGAAGLMVPSGNSQAVTLAATFTPADNNYTQGTNSGLSSFNVVKDQTTTAITYSSLDTMAMPAVATQIGRTLTVTATVTPTLLSQTPTGTPTITVTPSANATLQSCNTAAPPPSSPHALVYQCLYTVNGPLPNPASLTANASYPGDNYFQTSTATAVQIPIQKVITQTALTALVLPNNPDGANTAQTGRMVTLTATVTSTSGITNPPVALVGTVTFTLQHGTYASNPSCGAPGPGADQFTVVATTTAANATAMCTFTLIGPAGTDNYSAVYNGDGAAGNVAGSTATPNPLSITVLKDVTATYLVVSADPDSSVPCGASSPVFALDRRGPSSKSLGPVACSPTQAGRMITLTATTIPTQSVTPVTGTWTFTLPHGTYTTPITCGTQNGDSFQVTVNPAPGAGSTSATCTFIIQGPPQTNTYSVTYSGDGSNLASPATPAASQYASIPVILAPTATTITAIDDADPLTATQLGRLITIHAQAQTTSQNVFDNPSGNFVFHLPPGAVNNPASPGCGSTFGTVTPPATSTVVNNGTTIINQGTATATCSFIITGALGTANYTVTYGGDSNTMTSTSTATPITTVKAVTCIAAQGQPCIPGTDNAGTSYIYGQPVMIPLAIDTTTTTTVPGTTPGLPSVGINPTGTVTFNGIPNITATPVFTLPTSGASYQYPALVTLISEQTSATNNATTIVTPNVLNAGSYNVSAVYSGDTNYLGSSEPVTFTIGRAQTIVGVQGLTVPAGVPNLRVVVANSSVLGVGTPTGLVQVTTGGAGTGVVATGTLTPSGSCAPLAVSQCSAATISVPTGTYVGVYCGNLSGGVCTGDTNFLPGSSTPTQASGVTASSSLVITASPNPAPPGATIVLTATVSGLGGAGAPTGSVQFTDNGTIIGVAPLVAGVATLSINLTPGSHNIGGVYSGDATYPGATYNLGVTVTKPQPTTTFSSSLTTSVYGQQVVLTVRFTSPTQGGALPSGTVQFLNNGQNLGDPVQIVNGVATLMVTNLPVGADSIGVQYGGDSSYAGLTKNVGSVLVTQAQTTTALTTTTSGNQMTLTATVSVVAPGAGSPTGPVQFMDTVTQQVLGTATLNSSGVATITVAVTGDPVVATYQGDTNFLGSTSPKSSAATISLSNSASYVQAFAPGTIVVAFGTGLTTQTISGTLPLVTSLGGVTVTVTDSAGIPRLAPLFYVSPTQISFMIPPQSATGQATVTVATSTGSLTATITITTSASALYTANASGSGPLAAQVAVYPPTGQPTYIDTAALSGTTYVNAPISLTPTSNSYYLILYGTGFDNAKTVTVTINGQTYNPAYAGPQGTYPGLDQINVLLPSSLTGAGQVNVSITVDGQVSNVGTIAFAGGGTN